MNKRKGLRIFAIILIVLAFLLEGVYHFKIEPANRSTQNEARVTEEPEKEKPEETSDSSQNEKIGGKTETEEEGADKSGEQSSKKADVVQTQEKQSGTEQNISQQTISCSIEIVCHTIADKSKLTNEAVADYVPSSGVILPKMDVSVPQGSSVYDVLQKVTKERGVQMESKYTPLYGSYYIEGIGHIYEFDAGELSGWMYQVNGVSPNYGCSSYEVKEGDAIRWCYTCDLGKDVGGSNY